MRDETLDERKRFSERLKSLRTQRGLGQKELAARVRFERSTITAWETGKRFPRQAGLQKLADFFGVSLDYLTGRDEPNPVQLSIEHLPPEIQAFLRQEVESGSQWLRLILEMQNYGLAAGEITQILALFRRTREERKADSGSQPQ